MSPMAQLSTFVCNCCVVVCLHKSIKKYPVFRKTTNITTFMNHIKFHMSHVPISSSRKRQEDPLNHYASRHFLFRTKKIG